MSYYLKDRMTGKYLAKLPYRDADSRYVPDKADAQSFARYVDAFNWQGRSKRESVIED